MATFGIRGAGLFFNPKARLRSGALVCAMARSSSRSHGRIFGRHLHNVDANIGCLIIWWGVILTLMILFVGGMILHS